MMNYFATNDSALHEELAVLIARAVIAQNYEELDAIQRKFDALITEIRSSMSAPN
jgi:hypothetical protein